MLCLVPQVYGFLLLEDPGIPFVQYKLSTNKFCAQLTCFKIMLAITYWVHFIRKIPPLARAPGRRQAASFYYTYIALATSLPMAFCWIILYYTWSSVDLYHYRCKFGCFWFWQQKLQGMLPKRNQASEAYKYPSTSLPCWKQRWILGLVSITLPHLNKGWLLCTYSSSFLVLKKGLQHIL